MDNKKKAILFIILSSFSFSIMNTLVKMVGDIPSLEKALFRNGIALIVSFIILVTQKNKKKGHYTPLKNNRLLLLSRGVIGTLGMICLYISLDKINLADATMLNKMSPFYLIIFSSIFLKEKITLPQISAITTAFIGAMFVIKPTFSVETLPYLIGFLSGVFAGGAYTCVRALGNRGERGPVIVFYFSLTSTLILLPLVYRIFVPINSYNFVILLFSGIAGSIGQFSLTKAYSLAPSKEISIYDYSQMIFSSVWSYLIFSQLPDTLSFIGYIIILCASLYMYKYNTATSLKTKKA